MDKQEAKLILHSYRFNGQDANDPAFAEALQMAQRDPELAAWLEAERATDESISARLKESPVPADLRKAIISGLRSESRISRTAYKWWKSPGLAWAAVIVMAFVGAFLLHDKQPGRGQLALADYRLTMRTNLETLTGFDLPENEPLKIRKWLDSRGFAGTVSIPEQLVSKKSVGCKLFPYGESQSALICFQLPNMEMVHLFVIENSALGGVELTSSREFAKCGDWDTCCWEEEGNLYLLLGKVGTNTLEMLTCR